MPPEVKSLVDAFPRLGLLVVGDVCIDEYVVGSAERLSREAPVPVLSLRRRFCRPGGAANPAVNVAGLGARVAQVGVVGEDAEAEDLRKLLTEAGIDAGGLITDPSRPTTRKTRVMAEGTAGPQQVARVDRQCRRELAGAIEEQVVAAIGSLAPGADAVLVSDYKSGVVTAAVREAARRGASAAGVWLTADSQGDLKHFRGFGLVRAACRDAEVSLGRNLDSPAELQTAAEGLRADLGCRAVVISLGAEGMSVADKDGYAVVRPTNVSEVYDVTGAGDTVIAVATMALAAGAPVRTAVDLANRAAGIVVRRLGVAAVSCADLLATYED